eukprot:3753590-Prymnesium_polylepis.1
MRTSARARRTRTAAPLALARTRTTFLLARRTVPHHAAVNPWPHVAARGHARSNHVWSHVVALTRIAAARRDREVGSDRSRVPSEPSERVLSA